MVGNNLLGSIDRGTSRLHKRRALRIEATIDRIESLFTLATIMNQLALAQKTQMGRNPRLPHVEHLLQLGHRKLLARQKRKNPYPRRVSQ